MELFLYSLHWICCVAVTPSVVTNCGPHDVHVVSPGTRYEPSAHREHVGGDPS